MLLYSQFPFLANLSNFIFLPLSFLPQYKPRLTMAQKFAQLGAELTEEPRPLLPGRQESVHPGLRPSVTNVPVTPGMHLGEYNSSHDKNADSSYFTHNLSSLREGMAETPEANREVLKRLSLSGDGTAELVGEVDPRAANPGLGLSGGIISATFCIPHSLKYRKGQDWVRTSHMSNLGFLIFSSNWKNAEAHLLYSTLLFIFPQIRRLGITPSLAGLEKLYRQTILPRQRPRQQQQQSLESHLSINPPPQYLSTHSKNLSKTYKRKDYILAKTTKLD